MGFIILAFVTMTHSYLCHKERKRYRERVWDSYRLLDL